MATSDSDDQLSQDLIFDILSSPRRRYLLYYLRTHGGREEVTELAKHVAAWEYDVDVSDLDSQQQKRVYVSLYQTHVPKLADVGVVEYDPDTGLVELTDRAGEVEKYVRSDESTERPWQWYYLALSLVSFLALAIAGADLPPLGDVPDIFVGAFVGVAFATLAVIHYLTWQRDQNDAPDDLRT